MMPYLLTSFPLTILWGDGGFDGMPFLMWVMDVLSVAGLSKG